MTQDSDYQALSAIVKEMIARGHFRNPPEHVQLELERLGIASAVDTDCESDLQRYAGILAYCGEPMRDQDFFRQARTDLVALAREAIELRKVANAALQHRAGFMSYESFSSKADYYRAWLRSREEGEDASTRR